jgi:hypothetical protein
MTECCGAKMRSGGLCQAKPAPGKRRCRLHGGAEGSGAPFGRRNGNFKEGKFSKALRDQRLAETAERDRRSREWEQSRPKINYAKICAEIQQSALRKELPNDDKS